MFDSRTAEGLKNEQERESLNVDFQRETMKVVNDLNVKCFLYHISQ
jgi:hypothetical protein